VRTKLVRNVNVSEFPAKPTAMGKGTLPVFPTPGSSVHHEKKPGDLASEATPLAVIPNGTTPRAKQREGKRL